MDELDNFRKRFVELDHEVIMDLLILLSKKDLLNEEEELSVRRKNKTKARCLYDTVVKKGKPAIKCMVDYLRKNHHEHFSALNRIPSAYCIELASFRHACVEIEDKVITNVLTYLLNKKVFSDEDRESVRRKKTTKTQACCIFDIVMKKGEPATKAMMTYLKNHPQQFLTPDPAPSPACNEPSSKPGAGAGPSSHEDNVTQEPSNGPGAGAVRSSDEDNVAQGHLKRIRTEFIKRVFTPLINGVLDDLLEQKGFSTEDCDFVKQTHSTKADQARCLIDMVRGKGEIASQMMIDSIRNRDQNLYVTLRL